MKYPTTAILPSLLLGLAPAHALNPLCPPGVCIADPEVRQMPDGRVYLYGSRDEPGNTWCSRAYHVMSSPDLKHWDLDLLSFATAGPGKQTSYTDRILYAPDCIERKGTYYLYYCLADGGEDEGVATAKSPYGPFVNGRKFAGVTGIDPAVFIDDDGQGYLYWGQGNGKVAKLTPDMLDIDRSSIKEGVLIHNNSPYAEQPDATLATKEHWFNEGSSIRKRNGIYYLVYAQGGRHGRGCCACLAYATATAPMGPFTYRGVIIDNTGSAPHIVNNHGCIAEINGKWYVFYHRPTHGGPSMRKACVEPISFKADGSIPEVPMTTMGADGPLNPLLRMDAARACQMSGNVRVMSRNTGGVIVEDLAFVKDGDTMTYRDFDFTNRKAVRFTCKTWGKALAAKLELRLDKADGELIGTCDLAPSDGSTAFAIHKSAVKPVSGVHSLVLVARAAAPDSARPDLFSLEWFVFDRK
ncbi:MAG: family 43 glycosylhydrolase [Verrucomicrobia bacterium]|nr:family 43 glycosylhydrolase [Verrucomicrobiota bacterium]